MNKTVVAALLGLCLASTLALAVLRYYGDSPFSPLYGKTVKVPLCLTDSDGIFELNDDYACNNQKYLWSVRYYLAHPEGFEFVTLRLTGLEPDTYYQVKLDSSGPGFEADSLADACNNPNAGSPWMCGYWPYPQTEQSVGFVVLGIARTDSHGRMNFVAQAPTRLAQGIYKDLNFVVTKDASPWNNPVVGKKKVALIVAE